MNESWFSWLLVVEIVLPFVIVSILLIVLLVRGQSRYKDAMRELILNVKDNEPVQKEATQRFLHEKLGLDEKAVEKHSADIIRERKFFFRTFVSSVLNKDVENLASLDEELSRITEKYHDLAVGSATKPAQDESDASSDTSALNSQLEAKEAQIEALKQESKSLKQEVHITLTTLNNIFAEYSSMFGEDIAKKDMSVEQILTAMESFSGAKSEDSSSDAAPMDATTEDEPDDVSDLDSMPLEDISTSEADDDAGTQEESGSDDPSWEDAFEESGDEMEESDQNKS